MHDTQQRHTLNATYTKLQPLHTHTAHSWLVAHSSGATLGLMSVALAGPLYTRKKLFGDAVHGSGAVTRHQS
jgi:hypothetical protein